MTKQKKENPTNNDSSDSDSSDSDNENINLVIHDEKEKEKEKKNKRKVRFREENLANLENKKRKNTDNDNSNDSTKTPRKKPRKSVTPKQKPIIISLYDLLNPDTNWEQIQSGIQENNIADKNNPEDNYPLDPEEIMEEEVNIPLKYEYIDLNLETIDDLIKLGQDYLDGKYSPMVKYNINIYRISKLVKPLCNLKNMIGMDNIKRDVFELLLYQLQEFDNSKDMLHTIIEGEPGVGKTDLAKIMAEIYQEMGYCYNKIVKFVKRSDLIGGYLGQTAIKTQKVLDECKGGVLVIDEAYSLGSPEGKDSYSKECIDTLTSFLSESPDTIVFIMGYKEDLERSLFAQNKGLERRFSYRFTVNKYEPEELRLILFKIVRENGWDLESESDIPVSFFEKNMDYFPFNGGDMLNLFTKCKFTHSIRFFNKNKKSTPENNFENLKKKINYEDVKNAFRLLKKDEKFKNRNLKDDIKNVGMYT